MRWDVFAFLLVFGLYLAVWIMAMVTIVTHDHRSSPHLLTGGGGAPTTTQLFELRDERRRLYASDPDLSGSPRTPRCRPEDDPLHKHLLELASWSILWFRSKVPMEPIIDDAQYGGRDLLDRWLEWYSKHAVEQGVPILRQVPDIGLIESLAVRTSHFIRALRRNIGGGGDNALRVVQTIPPGVLATLMQHLTEGERGGPDREDNDEDDPYWNRTITLGELTTHPGAVYLFLASDPQAAPLAWEMFRRMRERYGNDPVQRRIPRDGDPRANSAPGAVVGDTVPVEPLRDELEGFGELPNEGQCNETSGERLEYFYREGMAVGMRPAGEKKPGGGKKIIEEEEDGGEAVRQVLNEGQGDEEAENKTCAVHHHQSLEERRRAAEESREEKKREAEAQAARAEADLFAATSINEILVGAEQEEDMDEGRERPEINLNRSREETRKAAQESREEKKCELGRPAGGEGEGERVEEVMVEEEEGEGEGEEEVGEVADTSEEEANGQGMQARRKAATTQIDEAGSCEADQWRRVTAWRGEGVVDQRQQWELDAERDAAEAWALGIWFIGSEPLVEDEDEEVVRFARGSLKEEKKTREKVREEEEKEEDGELDSDGEDEEEGEVPRKKKKKAEDEREA